jgi:hypothetical protein
MLGPPNGCFPTETIVNNFPLSHISLGRKMGRTNVFWGCQLDTDKVGCVYRTSVAEVAEMEHRSRRASGPTPLSDGTHCQQRVRVKLSSSWEVNLSFSPSGSFVWTTAFPLGRHLIGVHVVQSELAAVFLSHTFWFSFRTSFSCDIGISAWAP